MPSTLDAMKVDSGSPGVQSRTDPEASLRRTLKGTKDGDRIEVFYEGKWVEGILKLSNTNWRDLMDDSGKRIAPLGGVATKHRWRLLEAAPEPSAAVPARDLSKLSTPDLIAQYDLARSDGMKGLKDPHSPKQKRINSIVDLISKRADDGDPDALAWYEPESSAVTYNDFAQRLNDANQDSQAVFDAVDAIDGTPAGYQRMHDALGTVKVSGSNVPDWVGPETDRLQAELRGLGAKETSGGWEPLTLEQRADLQEKSLSGQQPSYGAFSDIAQDIMDGPYGDLIRQHGYDLNSSYGAAMDNVLEHAVDLGFATKAEGAWKEQTIYTPVPGIDPKDFDEWTYEMARQFFHTSLDEVGYDARGQIRPDAKASYDAELRDIANESNPAAPVEPDPASESSYKPGDAVKLPSGLGTNIVKSVDPDGRLRFDGIMTMDGKGFDPSEIRPTDPKKDRLSIALARTAPRDIEERYFGDNPPVVLDPGSTDALRRYVVGSGDIHRPESDMTAGAVNGALRDGRTHPDVPALDRAINAGSFPAGGPGTEGAVYRIVPEAAVGDLRRGDEYVDPAFMSTTVEAVQLEGPRGVLTEGGANPVRLNVIIPDGYPGIPAGLGFGQEARAQAPGNRLRMGEWILPRDTRYRVVSKGKKNVVLEVVPPGRDKHAAVEAPELPEPVAPVEVRAAPALHLGSVEVPVEPGDLVYRHKVGSYIVVHPDGSLVKYSATGKANPKTSATPDKLAAGHGAWTLVPQRDLGGVDARSDVGGPGGDNRAEGPGRDGTKYEIQQFGGTWVVGYNATNSWGGEPTWHALSDHSTFEDAQRKLDAMVHVSSQPPATEWRGRSLDTGLADAVPAQAVVTAPVEVETKSVPVRASATRRVPMDFAQAPSTDVDKYINDDRYVFQQKVDGIRGQLVVEPGKAPWFRSKSGDRLVNSSAAKVIDPLLKKMGETIPKDSPSYVVDGEVLDGKWYVFDMAQIGAEKMPQADRSMIATEWVKTLRDAGITNVEALPTARSSGEKQALWEAVVAGGAEGVMAKRTDAPYNFGRRVDHTIKIKVRPTADVVVMGVGTDGKNSADIGLLVGGRMTRVGTVAMQGKPDVKKGDVIEVAYLWANPVSHKIQQAAMERKRPDKSEADATSDQLRYVDKTILDVPDQGAVVEELNYQATELDPEVASAVRDYVEAGSFLAINAVLRGVDVTGLEDYNMFSEAFQGDTSGEELEGWVNQEAGDLDAAIATTHTTAPLTVYRGVSMAALTDLQPGAIINDPGYMSTSTDRSVAAELGEGGVVLELAVPTGYHALSVSGVAELDHMEQSEIILPRGTSYRITGVDETKGHVVVRAEVLTDAELRQALRTALRNGDTEAVKRLKRQARDRGLDLGGLTASTKHVRTPKGQDWYGESIGSPIVVDPVKAHIEPGFFSYELTKIQLGAMRELLIGLPVAPFKKDPPEPMNAFELRTGHRLESGNPAAIAHAQEIFESFDVYPGDEPTPDRPGPLDRVEIALLSMLKRASLRDEKGPVERYARRVFDAIGVDPYDVDVERLNAHLTLHERPPQSKYWFKSPCWASRGIDFAVHALLPAMIEQKYPDQARRLRNTSPRWVEELQAELKRAGNLSAAGWLQ